MSLPLRMRDAAAHYPSLEIVRAFTLRLIPHTLILSLVEAEFLAPAARFLLNEPPRNLRTRGLAGSAADRSMCIGFGQQR